MAYNVTTGVFTRAANSFSNPVTGTVIDPDNADELFDDYDLGLSIVHGKLIPPVGTATLAPLQYTAGTNLTTAAAGASEYDGKTFYSTPNALNRGVAPAVHILTLSAAQVGTNVNTAQPWFPGGGATGITLPAATTYFFQGELSHIRSAGTTSHTFGNLFGGTATLTSIGYIARAVAADSSVFLALGSQQISRISVATNTQIWSTASINADQVVIVRVEGIVRINGAGTFIPQFQFSAAPGGAPTISANTWFMMWPIGINTMLNVGNWS